jgi:hypothetical protein
MDGRFLTAGDCVYYGLDGFGRNRASWRVNCFYRKSPEIDWRSRIENVADQVCYDVCMRLREEERQQRLERGLPANKRYRLIPCYPHEATHVSLSGVSGTIAPIEECEFHKVVEWEAYFLAQHKARAISRVGRDPAHFTSDWYWE